MMLKVLINAVSAKSGGAATYIRNLARELASGNQTKKRYILAVPPSLAEAMGGLGENIALLPTGVGYESSWKRFLWDQFALRAAITNQRAGLLLSSSDFGMWLPPCKQILMIRNPLFFSPLYVERILPRKTWRFKLEFSLRRWLIALSAGSSDVIVTASQSMLNDVRRLIPIPDGKAVVNYFGVPLEKFNGEDGGAGKRTGEEAGRSQEGLLRMLYVSEYSDFKNLTTLLKAVLMLKEQVARSFYLTTTADPSQFPDVEIVSREEDQVLASQPRVASSVTFTGSIPYQEIQKLYQQSDLFVFPSLAESFGHPLVEAMASGLPILASDIPICREICGEAALYFNPLDPTDLAEKILLLKASPDLRRRLGEIGRKRAETHFDWKDHVRRLVEMIEQVAAVGRG